MGKNGWDEEKCGRRLHTHGLKKFKKKQIE